MRRPAARVKQAEFVQWWRDNVTVRQSPGDNQYQSSNAELRSTTLSKDSAETLTGITQQQVSRWIKPNSSAGGGNT